MPRKGYLLAKNCLLVMVTEADVAPSWAKDHKVSSSVEDYSHRSSRAKKRTLAKRKVLDSDKDQDYTLRSTRAKKGT